MGFSLFIQQYVRQNDDFDSVLRNPSTSSSSGRVPGNIEMFDIVPPHASGETDNPSAYYQPNKEAASRIPKCSAEDEEEKSKEKSAHPAVELKNAALAFCTFRGSKHYQQL